MTDGGRDNNWLGPWSHDGRLLMLASNRRSPDAMDAYLVDVATGQLQLTAANRGVGGLVDVSRDGRLAVLHRMVSRGDSDLYLIDLATGGETCLTPHEGPGSFGRGRFSPDGRTIYLSSNAERETIAFGRICLDDRGRPGTIELLAAREEGEARFGASGSEGVPARAQRGEGHRRGPSPGELDDFVISHDGATAALVWNVAGRSEISFPDLATRALSIGPPLPAELAGGLTFSRDDRLLAMTVSGSVTPPDIWVLDRGSGHLWQVTRSPHAGIDLSALVRPELVRFPAHDGLELSGWLYRSRTAPAPGPVVLSFHGGPEGQERPYFDSLYQALLAHGIAVFAPNVRGSSGFGKTFVNRDNGALRFDAIRDIEACVRFVIEHGLADPRRIGIMGGSYGGYMTMAGLVEYPELFAAGANLFGIVNFETFFAHTEPWMAAVSTIEYGDPEREPDLLCRLSPIHRIDHVRAPTIVLHGANDTNVPVVEAEQVVASLKARNVPVEYVLFPDEGHGFRKIPNRVRSTVAIVRWFTEHLWGG